MCYYRKDTSELNTTVHYPSVDWTLENDFPENAPVDSIPWRPWGAGRHLGLTVVLDANIEEYFCSSEASYGFKVTIDRVGSVGSTFPFFSGP